MTVALRPEKPDDECFLRLLIADTVTAELGAAAWPEPMRGHLVGIQCTARRQAVRSHFPDGRSWIVLVAEEPAGWLYTADLPDEVRVAEIMLAAAHRGRGVGTAVLRQVIRDADKPVRLWVNLSNVKALRFYERLGFQRIGGDEVQHLLELPAGNAC